MVKVLIDNKPLISPGGVAFEVPTEGLAAIIAEEWESDAAEIKKKGYGEKTFNSLAATALDKVPQDHEALRAQLIKICENDQLLNWEDHPESLVSKQEADWKPLIDKINEQLRLKLQARTHLQIRSLSPGEVLSLEKWCGGLNPFQLASFSYMTELAHSFIVPFCLVEDLMESPEVAWQKAELHESHQRTLWGEDPEDLERVQRLRREFIQAYKFFSHSL